MITDIDNSQVIVQPEYYALGGTRLRVTLEESGKMIAQEVGTAAENAPLVLKVKKAKLWSPDSPFLYDLRYEILDKEGRIIDRVNRMSVCVKFMQKGTDCTRIIALCI